MQIEPFLCIETLNTVSTNNTERYIGLAFKVLIPTHSAPIEVMGILGQINSS